MILIFGMVRGTIMRGKQSYLLAVFFYVLKVWRRNHKVLIFSYHFITHTIPEPYLIFPTISTNSEFQYHPIKHPLIYQLIYKLCNIINHA